jgi:restriction system protein
MNPSSHIDLSFTKRYPRKNWRTHIFVPLDEADHINRSLELEWGDKGDNISVPMSKTGENPVEFKGASGALDEKKISSLLGILKIIKGFSVFICNESSEGSNEVIATYGEAPKSINGKNLTWHECAESISLKRIQPNIYFPSKSGPEILLQTLINITGVATEGSIVEAVTLPWMAIISEIEKDPEFLYNFSKSPRKFEEFLAATYEREGWTEVILTPRSGDKGRDVIASKSGFGSIRILDQAKAFSPGHLVTHDDVRAMLGVLSTSPNSSKAILTTTSDFQSGILSGGEFSNFMPYRLELKNGTQLKDWLYSVRDGLKA